MKEFWKSISKVSLAAAMGLSLLGAGAAFAQPDRPPMEPGQIHNGKDFDPGRFEGRPDGKFDRKGPQDFRDHNERPRMDKDKHFGDQKKGKKPRKDRKYRKNGKRPDRERR